MNNFLKGSFMDFVKSRVAITQDKTAHNMKDKNQFEDRFIRTLNKRQRDLCDQYVGFLCDKYDLYCNACYIQGFRDALDIMAGD